ncbi:hypothetical protein CRG98_026806 [Punica granatum]|uniref:Uncharacterized protein n=1 Tax=Punica granatum TaxID=22663 RepID=A0A2I0JAY3_PUNGR|nr:hypothetical protein CRG98_026806 [Punica granatum]
MAIIVPLPGISCSDDDPISIDSANQILLAAAGLISTAADSPAGSPNNITPILYEETVSLAPRGAVKVEEDFIFLPEGFDGG